MRPGAAMLEAQAAEGLEATRRDAEVRARARADVARAEARLAEVEQKLTATRKEADLAQAELQRLHAERTHESEQDRREACVQYKGQPAYSKIQFRAMREADANTTATPTKKRAVARRGMGRDHMCRRPGWIHWHADRLVRGFLRNPLLVVHRASQPRFPSDHLTAFAVRPHHPTVLVLDHGRADRAEIDPTKRGPVTARPSDRKSLHTPNQLPPPEGAV